MANVYRSFEIRNVGGLYVVLAMYPPDFEMTKVATGDELVVNNENFFVLKNGQEFILGWETTQLKIVSKCQEYVIFKKDTILYKINNIWYFWKNTDSNEEVMSVLGKQIFAVCPAFISDDEYGYLFQYPDGDCFKTQRCIGYEVLQKQDIHPNNLLPKELFPDVLRLDTKDGPLFVSISKKSGPIYRLMRTAKRRAFFEFIFSKESSQDLIGFTDFANKTCKKLLEKGFAISVGWGGKYFELHEMKARLKNGEDVTVPIYVTSSQKLNVYIDLNLSKLYLKKNGAYKVKCLELSYFKEANDLRIEKSSKKIVLFIMSNEGTDKIYWRGQAMSAGNLSLERG